MAVAMWDHYNVTSDLCRGVSLLSASTVDINGCCRSININKEYDRVNRTEKTESKNNANRIVGIV